MLLYKIWDILGVAKILNIAWGMPDILLGPSLRMRKK